MSEARIVVALDMDSEPRLWSLVDRLDPGDCRLKVGKELFTRFGPGLVERLTGRGFDVFLDLKYHDIPNTVGRACAAAADLGVWMLNVHASGGRRMMEAARDALEGVERRPLLIAVTVLTSLDGEDLEELGWCGEVREQVDRLAALAARAGLDGVVCSAREAGRLRRARGADFRLVTPGIRPAGEAVGDQRRVMTPAEALRAGSDYLVIGRPVTAAPDPRRALARIQAEIDAVIGP